jgi:hypothetical protein
MFAGKAILQPGLMSMRLISFINLKFLSYSPLYLSLLMKLVVGYSMTSEQPQSSNKPVCHCRDRRDKVLEPPTVGIT